MAYITPVLAFQMGFCWKGNRNLPFFTKGTKGEMIHFILEGIQGFWEIMATGIPEKHGEEIVYCPLNAQNIQRNDSLGEFLNRPLFLLRSKIINGGE